MRKYFGIALFSMVAALFISAPAANAQSVDFRVGSGYGHHRGGGVSVDIHIGDRGWGRGPVYRGGCGRYDNCYPNRPVYRQPYPVYRDGCDRGCNDGYYERIPAPIEIYVSDWVTRYDRYGRPCGEERISVRYIAHWDVNRGGYWYTDNRGIYRRAPGY